MCLEALRGGSRWILLNCIASRTGNPESLEVIDAILDAVDEMQLPFSLTTSDCSANIEIHRDGGTFPHTTTVGSLSPQQSGVGAMAFILRISRA